MRKVKPAFDTNDAVATFAFWRTPTFPFIAGGRINGIYSDSYKINEKEYVIQTDVLFALKVSDGLKLCAEIEHLRRKHGQAQDNLTRIMAQHRSRSVLGQLDPK